MLHPAADPVREDGRDRIPARNGSGQAEGCRLQALIDRVHFEAEALEGECAEKQLHPMRREHDQARGRAAVDRDLRFFRRGGRAQIHRPA